MPILREEDEPDGLDRAGTLEMKGNFDLGSFKTVHERNFIGIVFGEIVPNRATERANDAKGAISKIAESISYVFSVGVDGSIPPASTILSLLESITAPRVSAVL
jgi:hypothetical protein